MPAVARTGDMASHGTPLTPDPGIANVRIGVMLDCRATADFHTCPQVDLVTKSPHVGCVIALGSTTILINNLPATRIGDFITESGPPNALRRIVIMSLSDKGLLI